MKILALIAARGGSMRLPGKNIRILGKKPLTVWSIEVARDISEICEILVSTDDVEISKICQEAGALVPWLRPAELASDTAKLVDVALHALEWYESAEGEVDGLLLLQPTSPFRSKECMRKGIDLFSRSGGQAVIAVSPTRSHPLWNFKIENEHLVPYIQDHGLETRSQDLPAAYVVNGSFYLITPAELRARESFFGVETKPLIINSEQESLDIDTEWDFRIAELIAENIHEIKSH